MHKSNAFEDKMAFLYEKLSKAYQVYDEVSIAVKKGILTQKTFQSSQLCWVAGKVGE